jgi:hypothetical protein
MRDSVFETDNLIISLLVKEMLGVSRSITELCFRRMNKFQFVLMGKLELIQV